MLDRFLNSYFYLVAILFLMAAFFAFWPGFFSILGSQPHVYNHFHGWTMTAWCLLLIIQPLLIRWRMNAWHVRLGTLSYLLVPMLLLSILALFKNNMKGIITPGEADLAFAALVINAAIAFVLLYILAIRFRRQSGRHARYMISTLFPMMTPVTDRLIARNLPSWIEQAPVIGGAPILPFYGFILSDILILILIYWDWKKSKKLDVFPLVLVIVGLFQISVFTFYKWQWWKSFCIWLL